MARAVDQLRHQLGCFASLGFRAIAPDLRGYGRSSVYPSHGDYAVAHIVEDRAQEKPVEVNAAIARWLATALPAIWLTQPVRTPNP